MTNKTPFNKFEKITRPPAPSGSGVRLSDQLTQAKIRYYNAKTAYYEKLANPPQSVPIVSEVFPHSKDPYGANSIWTPSNSAVVGTQGFDPNKESQHGQADQAAES
jgi:hypothetical protein